jgi:4-carboxymuconolactone decarboxylase
MSLLQATPATFSEELDHINLRSPPAAGPWRGSRPADAEIGLVVEDKGWLSSWLRDVGSPLVRSPSRAMQCAANRLRQGVIMATYEETLRRLALQDEQYIDAVFGICLSGNNAVGLDLKGQALVRLAALIALEASSVSYSWAIEAALTAGATIDDILATLIAVAPITGLARVVAATPDIACSIGYDIDQAFEALDSWSRE